MKALELDARWLDEAVIGGYDDQQTLDALYSAALTGGMERLEQITDFNQQMQMSNPDLCNPTYQIASGEPPTSDLACLSPSLRPSSPATPDGVDLNQYRQMAAPEVYDPVYRAAFGIE